MKTLVLIVTILFLLTGYTEVQRPMQNELAEISKPSYSIVSEVFYDNKFKQPPKMEVKGGPWVFDSDNNDITVRYPQIQRLQDRDKEALVNELIKFDVLTVAYDPDENLPEYADFNYQVMLQNDEVLSIMYTGLVGSWRGMHNYKAFHGTTIDIVSGKILELSDVVVIDENLVKAIKGSTNLSGPEIRNAKDLEFFINHINRDFDDQWFIGTLKGEKDTYAFYLTSDSLVIGVSAGTSYVWITIQNHERIERFY